MGFATNFFRNFGRAGRIKEMSERLRATSPPRSRAFLASLPESDRADVVVEALRWLMFDDEHGPALALVAVATDLALDTVDLHLAVEGLYVTLGRRQDAVSACERALALEPEKSSLVALLARRLVEAGRAQEALEVLDVSTLDTVEIDLERGYALSALERHEEAHTLLVVVVDRTEAVARQGLFASEPMRITLERARELRDAVHNHTFGAETVHEQDLGAGRLDAKAGVNYRIMARKAMLSSGYVPARTTLESPEETLEALPKRSELDAAGLARLGTAELRLGRTGAATRRFEKALDLDARCYPALLGMGAVLDADEYRYFSTAKSLPMLRPPRGIEQIVPDYAALTELERAVVVASVMPLAAAIPALVESGARIVLLPIDVRVVDRDEWKADTGARFDDGRLMDGLGGVADSGEMLAAARIENLLDLRSQGSLVFAHEFAHLVFYVLDDIEPLIALFSRARASRHVATHYQLSNEHEFFAVAYEDYLRSHYGLPQFRVLDESGVLRDTFAYFDAFAHGKTITP